MVKTNFQAETVELNEWMKDLIILSYTTFMNEKWYRFSETIEMHDYCHVVKMGDFSHKI